MTFAGVVSKSWLCCQDKKDRMRAREYHWRADIYIYIIYVNSSLDVHENTLNTERFEL